MLPKYPRRASAVVLPLVVLFICCDRGIYSQTFSSGSTGADGALNLTTPGTIIFDPKTYTPPLNPAGDNVFNFTTITIAQGVTLKLTSKILTGPVYFLASGAVQIDGTIDLNGDDGQNVTSDPTSRVPAAGGAGGFFGGVGGTLGTSSPPAAGNGPGGGVAGSTSPGQGGAGKFVGSQYLIPLIGGGGGGGGSSGGCLSTTYGGGGGGGGGAILIASSVSIGISNAEPAITARGGAGGGGGGCNGLFPFGGTGGGGAIRLMAPTINVAVGPGTIASTIIVGNGTVRLESFSGNPNNLGVDGNVHLSVPFSVVPPASPPSSIKVTSLVTSAGTIPINANPFSFPDATINSSVPITVNVQAQFIPTGTVPQITVVSETGPDQSVSCSAGLAGTLQQSTCSAQITFPTGGSRGFVKATWTQ